MKPRFAVPFVCALVLLVCTACSGGVAPSGDGGAAEGGGVLGDAATPEGGTPEGGTPEAGAVRCTPGASVFGRCADRTEGTKLCTADGQAFEPCSTAAGPC
jgi:hypothetical protein